MDMQLFKIEDIVVIDRHRTNFGNIEELANNIKDNGLINPITITDDMRLIAGERRLRAMKFNQETMIPAVVVSMIDEEGILKIEYSENEYRKEFTPSEKFHMLKALTPKKGGANNPNGLGGKTAKSLSSGQNKPLDKTDERRDERARAVGLPSKGTAVKLGKVMKHGSDEIKRLIDEGKLPISTAADFIIELPEKFQERIIAYIDNGGKSRHWRKEQFGELMKEFYIEGKISEDQAMGFQMELDTKRKSPSTLKARVKSMVKQRDINMSNYKAKKATEERKKKKEEEKWNTINVSTQNQRQSAKNILEYFGYENSQSIIKTMQKIKREHIGSIGE